MRSRQTSNIKRELTYIIAIGLVALFLWRFFPVPGEKIGELIFRPLLQGETALRGFVGAPEQELTESELNELRQLQAENDQLRSLLGESKERRIGAGVIGRPSSLPYDVLVIDRGERDGVLMDAPVYVDERTVIGYVIAVYQDSSLVALASTPGFTSTVYVFGPNIYTTAVGVGGGVTRIHVPQGIALTEGDIVVVPSFGGGIYGSVEVIDSVPERPEQYGYVTTNTPISSLKNVAIGTRPLSIIDFETARQVIEAARQNLFMVNVPDDLLIEIEHASTTEAGTSTESGGVATSNQETL